MQAPCRLTGRAISYSGSVHNGVQYDAEARLIHVVGSAVKILREGEQPQYLRSDDTGKVSCLALCPSRTLLAVGKATGIGAEADIHLWTLRDHSLLHRCTLHKGIVQALAFSADGKWLASVGGPDDDALVIWEVATGRSVCGAPASATDVAFFHQDPDRLATCGRDSFLCVWRVDRSMQKLVRLDVKLGQLRRDFTCMSISADDEFMYAGSSSGDVAEVSTGSQRLSRCGPKAKTALSCVAAIQCMPGGCVLCGGHDGRLAILEATSSADRAKGHLSISSETQLPDAITSIACSPSASGTSFCVGTATSGLFSIDIDLQAQTFTQRLIMTAHAGRINDVAFPTRSSDLVVTCAREDVRIWDVTAARELRRIRVPRQDCLCLAITQAGDSILVGCSDGHIRLFAPESGALMHDVHDAHQSAVLSVLVLPDGRTVISGDEHGYVRAWRLGAQCKSHGLLATMKEHRGAVNRIAVRRNGLECVSASSDGSAILWDLTTFKRRVTFSASTFFRDAAYCTDESQVVTAGTDHKVTYWDAFIGEAIRELEGAAAMTSLDMHPGGQVFASGDAKGGVQIWHYDQGDCFAVGQCHTAEVVRCVFSPCGAVLASVDAHGALVLWKTDSLTDSS